MVHQLLMKQKRIAYQHSHLVRRNALVIVNSAHGHVAQLEEATVLGTV